MSAPYTLDQLRAGSLLGIKRLKLACGLTEFPREIFDLAETLEILDLTGNQLAALPDDLARLSRLRILFCSDNLFTALPASLGACPNLSMIGFKANRIAEVAPASLPPSLRWLTLTDNRIEQLPATIGDCASLQKLMLAGNRLTRLPPELARCTGLELIRISANRLDVLPDWLPALPRLSWLAYAGNPFCAQLDQSALADTRIGHTVWQDLSIKQQLGEGASGVIYQADQHGADGVAPVAVKLFKGAVTSDGLPASEMAACLRAGSHPNLIPALSRIVGHPDGANGLVMPLVDARFANLAGPPSLESCTRDVYAGEQVFGLDELLRIAHGIASAASHLHRRGILHGDLYAHNILHDGRGGCLLGDFGAASLFDPAAPGSAALRRLDTRAFGCLLEELIARCQATAANQPQLARLAAIRDACLDQSAQQRPPMEQVEAWLLESCSIRATTDPAVRGQTLGSDPSRADFGVKTALSTAPGCGQSASAD